MCEDLQAQIDELESRVKNKDNLIGHLYGRISVLEDVLAQSNGLLDPQSLDSLRKYIASKNPSDYTQGVPGVPVHRQNGAIEQLGKIRGNLSV